jgi:hypothetical protein
MQGKLIKMIEGFVLLDDKSNAIGQTFGKFKGKKLSLKNCQEIESGYDLGELACNEIGIDISVIKHIDHKLKYDSSPTVPIHEAGAVGSALYHRVKGFEIGFQKALEILGDKKFTEEDILIAMTCMFGQEVFYETTHEETVKSRERYIESYVKHLHQNEWEVIVEMEYIGECNGNNNNGCFQDSPGHDCGCFKREPKLDSDGCLILKRI